MTIDVTEKAVATNRKAYHDYFIEEKFEAGIMLQGTEVKSLREGMVRKRCPIDKTNRICLYNGIIKRLSVVAGTFMNDPPTVPWFGATNNNRS